MPYINILVETEPPIGIIRLNRPKALNALNFELIRETAAALGPLCQAARQRVLTDFNLERNRQQFLDDLLNIIFPGQSLACLGMGDKRSAHDISEPDGHEDSLLQ